MSSSRLRWALLAVAVTVYVGLGLSRISFDVDILRLLPAHLPQVEGLSLFMRHFSQRDEFVVTLEAASPDEAAAAADSLAETLGSRSSLVSRAVSRPPWESRPAEIAEFVAFALLNQPPERVTDLIARLSPAEAPKTVAQTLDTLGSSIAPEEIALAAYDPYGLAAPLAEAGLASAGAQSEFSSADGLFRVIYVQSAKPFANYFETSAWVEEFRRIVGAWQRGRNVAVSLTGEPAFVAEISAGMQWDMMSSGFATLILIGATFWVCYRRVRPLHDLLAMLVLTFLLSLATAGFFLGELTVIGAGFASVMIGLSVDYGYFIYQRSRRHTGPVGALQRDCFQNVAWTAGTTAAAFLALNLSSLPGLSQLGTLVGVGVIIGAAVMLAIFAPLAVRSRKPDELARLPVLDRAFASPRFRRAGAWVAGAVVIGLLAALAAKGFPGIDFSAQTLRPRTSDAYAALDRLYARLTDDRNLLSLVTRASNDAEMRERLASAQARLEQAAARGDVRGFRTPLALWPDSSRQRLNLEALAPLAAELPRLRQTLDAAGFTDEAFGLTAAVVGHWQRWRAAQPASVWPESETSKWILRRMASRQPGQMVALGVIEPVPGRDESVAAAVGGDGIYAVSWDALGRELRKVVPGELRNIIAGLFAAVLLLLAAAFRSARMLAAFTAVTTLVIASLAGAMSLLGATWNFFNVAAILLLLGTGTDYSILLLLALRRNGGDAVLAQREIGPVVALCCASSAIGFGALGWANTAGLATLGQTCAIGLVIDALVSIFLLPPLWNILRRRTAMASANREI